jgi:hypothetical protein
MKIILPTPPEQIKRKKEGENYCYLMKEGISLPFSFRSLGEKKQHNMHACLITNTNYKNSPSLLLLIQNLKYNS